jgi:hypothetical protein
MKQASKSELILWRGVLACVRVLLVLLNKIEPADDECKPLLVQIDETEAAMDKAIIGW